MYIGVPFIKVYSRGQSCRDVFHLFGVWICMLGTWNWKFGSFFWRKPWEICWHSSSFAVFFEGMGIVSITIITIITIIIIMNIIITTRIIIISIITIIMIIMKTMLIILMIIKIIIIIITMIIIVIVVISSLPLSRSCSCWESLLSGLLLLSLLHHLFVLSCMVLLNPALNEAMTNRKNQVHTFISWSCGWHKLSTLW